MKKIFICFTLIFYLTPKQSKAQNEGAAAIGGLLAIGATIAAVESMKEQAELTATEWLLSNHPELTSFYVRTLDFKGKKLKDMSAVSVITFKIREFEPSEDDIEYGKKRVLFGFTSHGWISEYGIDFNKVSWFFIDDTEWMNMMVAYVKVASAQSDVRQIKETLETGKVVNKGVKIKSKLVIPFFELDGDMYVVTDYSQDIKLIYNERSLGIYLKGTSDLVQIRRSTIIEIHDFLYPND